MPSATTFDIAATRAELEQRRAVLTAERPSVALRAAGGDAPAIERARHLTAELSDITVRLEGLDLAEDEVRRLEAVRKEEAAARVRNDLAATAAMIRARLGHELAELEPLMISIGMRCELIDGLGRELDQLASRLHGSRPYRRVALAHRIRARLQGAWRFWQEPIPITQDARPLGDGDVPG